MASREALKNYYTFSKGLMTEASPLTPVEGACSDMSNVVLESDGSLRSRQALELIASEITIEGSTAIGTAYSYAVAESIENDTPASSRLALYIGGEYIYVFNIEDITAPSLIDSVAVPPSPTGYTLIAGRGVFVATCGEYDPVILRKSNTGTGGYYATSVVLYERDLVGIDDGYPATFRPTTLTNAHQYNLLNQGWTSTGWATVQASAVAAYPSNADVYASMLYTAVGTGKLAIDPVALDTVGVSRGHAPRGHVVRSVFNQSDFSTFVDYGPVHIVAGYVSATSGIVATQFTIEVYDDVTGTVGATVTVAGLSIQYRDGSKSNWMDLSGSYAVVSATYSSATDRTSIVFDINIPVYFWTWNVALGTVTSLDTTIYNPSAITESARPQCAAFFAGRLWYSGIVPTTNYRLQSAVFFSRVLESMDVAGHCFQVGDPTATSGNEVVDSDGGMIPIAEMGTVYKMLPLGRSLILFAENGVWAVSGTANGGLFTPTSFQTQKLSGRGVASKHCAVAADGVVFYYSNSYLMAVIPDENSGNLTVRSVSDSVTTKMADLEAVHTASRVFLTYDMYNKRVLIGYGVSPVDYGDVDTEVLVFDTTFGAFLPLSYTGEYMDASNYAGLCGVFGVSYKYTKETGAVYLGLKNTADVFTVGFYTQTGTGIIDAHHDDADEYESYMTTAPSPLDSARMTKTMPQVGVFMERLADSTLKVQGRFSWSADGNSGKWGTKQQCYFDRGASYDVCWRTLRIRGDGKAVQLHFTNDAQGPFHLYGWDVQYTGDDR